MEKLYENLGKKTTVYGNVRNCMEIGGKKSLYGNVRNCTEIGKKTPTLYGNVRKSDLVEIWSELASQLDLSCSENVKSC